MGAVELNKREVNLLLHISNGIVMIALISGGSIGANEAQGLCNRVYTWIDLDVRDYHQRAAKYQIIRVYARLLSQGHTKFDKVYSCICVIAQSNCGEVVTRVAPEVGRHAIVYANCLGNCLCDVVRILIPCLDDEGIVVTSVHLRVRTLSHAAWSADSGWLDLKAGKG